jgi:small subunit ribosomal protein S17
MRLGVVTSDRMDKTVVVQITQTIRHPLYPKIYRRRKSLYAHDETNTVKVGDTVRVMETRPMSKLKRWRVVEVLERAK